ncbi:hypothetical protein N7462_000593 [Penicillium macrosclerotiorum]|uniref:uncharacterized protein n=1 Tax=Penicillium macrosclerotiorum TaxID=303699 RepID=UPI0025478CD5|nr:uncharacterized protein N7462_000593 [Penicillium macrosclerotiorum]KAJ5698588.1 hypothetical protein N7462_000593 [Penicillium macrosclerotiorum]
MPSLTLTDPDMILPYDGSERESQTPSPPSQLVYLTNLNARYNAADPHAGSSVPASRAKKSFSRHNWPHEDVNARRLSDIGEELSPSYLDGFEGDLPTPRSQQTSAAQLTVPVKKDQAGWSSSNSTVSAGSGRASREVSPPTAREAPPKLAEEVNKSNGGTENTTMGSLPASHVIASAAKGKGPGEEFSSAILSSEAERILENAKKRLTLMEGNLNRARSSVRLTPSPSPSAPGNISPMGLHQPVGGLYRSISRTDRKGSALRRQSFLPSQDASTKRHSRVHSETNFPPESSLSTDTKQLSRSVSAMGSSSISSFHNDERTFQYDRSRSYLTHRASISSMKPPHLELAQSSHSRQSPAPLESPVVLESPVSQGGSSSESPQGLGISADDESKSNGGDFSPVYSSYGPPSRAQSQLQVRDLQYQMKGLHIKISSLKVRTQEDNLRRRSLQSLRTPSPLTAADPWYQNGLEIRDGRSSQGSARRDGSSEYARETHSRSYEDAQARDRHDSYNPGRSDESPGEKSPNTPEEAWQRQGKASYHDGRQSATDSMYEDAEEGDYFDDGEIDREALDEILREPLDADLATPHEEREDAFDYEHFILHSALGNYTQQLRRTSMSSRGSVETTRPTQSVRHSRTNSSMSVSTQATFATATEGEPMPDDADDILYWDRRFNHELRHQHTHNQHVSPPIGTDRSQTPRGPRQDGTDTPVNVPQSPSRVMDLSGRSPSNAGSATPTSLVSSLVSTVRAASSPHPGPVSPTSGGINDDDTQMLEQLFQSLGNVCMDLQAITTSPDPDVKAARVLRRRLDAARRVLEGELDA